MKITATDQWTNKPVEMSVSSMVETAIRPDAYSYSGALEEAKATASNATEALAKLVERLVEKDVLNFEDLRLIGLVPYRFEDAKLAKDLPPVDEFANGGPMHAQFVGRRR